MAIETIPQSGLWGDIADTHNRNNEGQLTKSGWQKPPDDYTIQKGDNRIDGFPDDGIAENATYTLLDVAQYAEGWSCDIYNDTLAGHTITLQTATAAELTIIKPNHGVNVRKAGSGFLLVKIKGEDAVELDPAIWGDFDNWTVWETLPGTKFTIKGAAAAQLSGYPSTWTLDTGAGVLYDIYGDARVEDDIVVVSMYFTSFFDSTNPQIARISRRYGATWAATAGVDWIGDTEQVEFVNAQSFVNQQPTALDELLQFNFGGAQNLGGDIELQADGTLQFNNCDVSTQAITVQYGRIGSSGTSHLFMYATVNPTGSSDPAADIPVGRNFYAEINNANVVIPLFAQNNWLAIPNNGFQIKYWCVRDSSGNNSGGLLATAVSFNHNGNVVPDSASAGLTAVKIR